MKNRATKGNVPKGTSASGTPSQPSCFSNLKGKCTKPSCNCWHPPECVKYKTKEGCQCGEKMCVSSFTTTKHQGKCRKKDPTSEKKQYCNRTQQSLIGLCISGRRIARTDGWTCERETVFFEEERQEISESASRTHIHENCGKNINIREQVGPPLGVILGGPNHHRNPNTPTFADRDPNNKLWAEDGARKAA